MGAAARLGRSMGAVASLPPPLLLLLLLLLLAASAAVPARAGADPPRREGGLDERLLSGWKLGPKQPIPRPPFAALFIDDVAEGAGAAAEPGDTAVAHYTGRLLSGKKFDSSYLRPTTEYPDGKPLDFKLGAGVVIPGWDVGIAGDLDGRIPPMREGGTRMLYVPYSMAYGDRGAGTIGPREDLVFEVKLVGLLKSTRGAARPSRQRIKAAPRVPAPAGEGSVRPDALQALLLEWLPFRWALHKALSAFLLCTSAAHFGALSSLRLADMVPRWLGDRGRRRAIVTAVGAAQLALAVLLQVRGLLAQRLAGFGAMALFVCLIPANVRDLVEGLRKKNESLDAGAQRPGGAQLLEVTDVYRAARLPLQGVLILWAYLCSPGLAGAAVDPWAYYSS